MEDLKFAQMLCSRLCHDLITPIGAINSGFEILQDCDSDDDCQGLMDLTRNSAETAARRLTFYRAAYGYSGIDLSSQYLSVKKLLEDFLKPLKINFYWQNCDQCHENPSLVSNITLWSKVLINSVLLITESLPYGGDVVLSYNLVPPQLKFSFTISGKFMGFRPELVSALQNKLKPDAYTPQVIHGILILRLLQELRATFHLILMQDQQCAFEIVQQ